MASVAVIGPDGAGKTTVSQMLERAAPFSARYLYMGNNPLASNVMLPTTRLAAWLRVRRRASQGRSSFAQAPPLTLRARLLRRCRRLARFLNNLAEESYRFAISGWYQLLGRVVIYDRHPLFDYAPSRTGDPRRFQRLHYWLLSRWAPKPGLVIYLDAPIDVLLARRHEFPRERLQQIIDRLLDTAAQQPAFVRVNADQPISEVCTTMVAEIQKFLNRETTAVVGQPGPAIHRRRSARQDLRVLTYHRVGERPSRAAAGSRVFSPSMLSATPSEFDRSMRWLSQHAQVIDIAEVLASVRENRPLPDRAVLLTFDDAYRDFGEIAWPILRTYRLPATLFVPTAFPDGSQPEFWWDRLYRALASAPVESWSCEPIGRISLRNDREARTAFTRLRAHVKALPHADALRFVDQVCRELQCPPAAERSVLNWDELRDLAGDGVTLGAHTRSHPILTKLSADERRAEIQGAREDLLREIGSSRPVFAYPSGITDPAIVSLVRNAGYELAFSTEPGQNRMATADPLQLRRTNVTVKTSARLLPLRLTAVGHAVDRWRRRRTADAGERVEGHSPARIAYIMSRFPKLTETFVLFEMLAIEQLGLGVEVYPLLRVRKGAIHKEARGLVARAHFHGFLSGPVITANLHFLWHCPLRYFRTLFDVMRGTWGSLNFFGGGLAIFPKSVRFAYEMTEQQITHIHAHFANHPTLSAFIVNRLTGIPFSFTAHAFDIHVERRMLDKKLEAASFAVTISESNRRLMIAESPESAGKIHVVHCGVDPRIFKPATVRIDTSLQLVCVASLEPVKGHRYLIEACRVLRERGLAFTCHLVGQGSLGGALERQIADDQLESRVMLHGGLPRDAVAEMVGRSDVVVLPSAPTKEGKREGIPVALMEAMAVGLPIVSTVSGSIPELVETGVTGLLVAPADPIALADALSTLAMDPGLRRGMGAAGRAKVLREFNLEANAETLAALFTSSAFPEPSSAVVGVNAVAPAPPSPEAGPERVPVVTT